MHRSISTLDDWTAATLTEGMIAGDSQALATLYEARFDWMVGVLRGTLLRRGSGGRRVHGDDAFVLDCVQDAWLRVARRPVRCANLGALEAWLRRVALTSALDRLRSETARRLREIEVGLGAGRAIGQVGTLAEPGERGGRAGTPTSPSAESFPCDDADAEARARRPRSAWTGRPRSGEASDVGSDDGRAVGRGVDGDAVHAGTAAGEVVEAMEAIDALRAALDGADTEARGLLLLRYRAGLTVVQIAAAVGLGPAAVDSRLRRAIERLRDGLVASGRTPQRESRGTNGWRT